MEGDGRKKKGVLVVPSGKGPNKRPLLKAPCVKGGYRNKKPRKGKKKNTKWESKGTLGKI